MSAVPPEDRWAWMEEVRDDTDFRLTVRSKSFLIPVIPTRAYCLLHRQVFPSREELLQCLPFRRVGDPGRWTKIRILEDCPIRLDIGPDSHAVRRWNERVGPPLDGPALQNLLCFLHALNRIVFHSQGWGVIDGDIVFGWKREEKVIIIQTFLGRRSLHHPLYHYDVLLQYVKRHEEFLDLSVPPDVLRRQHFPPLPRACVEFYGENSRYRVEEYEYARPDGKVGVVFLIQYFKRSRMTLSYVDPNEPPAAILTRRVLGWLWGQGYEDFVIRYLVRNRYEKLFKQYQKFKRLKKKQEESWENNVWERADMRHYLEAGGREGIHLSLNS